MSRVTTAIINLLNAAVWAFIMVGCNSNPAPTWTNFANLPASGWNVLDGREFRPFEKDSIPEGEYEAVIVVRHTDAYPYKSLWLEIEQADAGVIATDTIEVKITDSAGGFLGSGPFGLYEVADTLPRKVKINPGWQMAVRHIMQPETIGGINNVGLILNKTNYERGN